MDTLIAGPRSEGSISGELLREILARYRLPLWGTHGLKHWARVLDNGRRLAAATPGADFAVVELFAVFHDARRHNESWDDTHGPRGAALARELRRLLPLAPAQLDELCAACEWHTVGTVASSPTVAACWDADRLDLGRVGIVPVPHRLLTDAARRPSLLDWAHQRADADLVLPIIEEEWGVTPSVDRER